MFAATFKLFVRGIHRIPRTHALHCFAPNTLKSPRGDLRFLCSDLLHTPICLLIQYHIKHFRGKNLLRVGWGNYQKISLACGVGLMYNFLAYLGRRANV